MKSQNPTKPIKPRDSSSLLSRKGNIKHKAVPVLLVIIALASGVSVLVLASTVFQPQIAAVLQIATLTSTPIPTPLCVQPTLSLGAYIYPLDVITVTEESTMPIPGGPAANAFWLSDTISPYVVIFEPAIRNLSLQDVLIPGDQMVVQWADCGREEFILTDIQPGSVDIQSLLAQTDPGIVVIIQPVGTTEGYVLHGQGPELANPPTPEPSGLVNQWLDITLGETVVSDDKQNLLISLTVANRSSQVITMTYNDLSLAAEGKEPLTPLSIDPVLPQEIQPGESLGLVLVFPNPGSNTAVLRVLEITVDLHY